MATTSMTKAKGIFSFANYLSAIPEGAQLQATNVVIDRDGIIEPRRGIKVLGESTDIPKQLLTFKNNILVHSDDVIEYSNGQDPATFTTFKGKSDFSPVGVDLSSDTIQINLHGLNEGDAVVFSSTGTLPSPLIAGDIYYILNPTQNTFQLSITKNGTLLDLTSTGSGTHTIVYDYEFDEVESGLRVKYIELNGNLYITTATGIKKVVSNNEFSVTNAGGVKALDLILTLDLSSSVGFLENSKEVAYRVVWGTKDINNNLILGVPSYRAVIQNVSGAGRNVFIEFSVPDGITTDYFYQIYRTNNADFNGSGDEMRLVYEEAYSGGSTVTVLDEQPEDLRNIGTPLYNNEFSGEGALQTNDPPPISHDISVYKNTAFYANTTGVHKTDFTLLGLDGFRPSYIYDITGAFPATITTLTPHSILSGNKVAIVSAGPLLDGVYTVSNVTSTTFDIDADSANYAPAPGDSPTAFSAYITISKNGIVNDYFFVGKEERFNLVYKAKSAITPSSYFLLNSINGDIKYCFWYDTTGSDPQPTLTSPEGVDRAFIRIDISGLGNIQFQPAEVDTTADTITIIDHGFSDGQSVTFTSENTLPAPLLSGTTYYIVNSTTDDFQVSTTSGGSAIDLTTQGVGIHTIQNNAIVTASDVEEVTTSIMFNTGDFQDSDGVGNIETTNAGPTSVSGYPSGQNGSAGFEGLTSIYILSHGQGEDLAKQYVRASTLLSPAAQIEDTARSLVRNINANVNEGVYAYYTPTSDALPGAILLESRTRDNIPFTVKATYDPGIPMFNPDLREETYSLSEINPNKLYFSKIQQPEAVPITNSLLIGPKDKAILRILGLRDSLFILKEEGIYRLTGDNFTNFTVSLFDNSATILAPDTACVLNNKIYCLSTQGIVTVDEGGVGVVSRPIEDTFLKLTSPAFTNFKTQSFALGYESDRSYIIFVPKTPTDTAATECYRYNTFTESWTSWDKSATCGVVETSKNRLYTGASDIPAVEIERKDLTSRDYADRQYPRTISVYDFNYIYVDDTSNMVIGDVLTQTQTLSLSQFNKFVDKANFDPILEAGLTHYTLGTSMQVKLEDTIDKLNIKDTSRKSLSFDVVADINPGTKTITIANHGFELNDLVVFTGTPFDYAQRDYYIINTTTNTFQISLTKDGNAFDITQGSSGTATVSNEYIYDNPSFENLGNTFNRMTKRLNASLGVFFSDYQIVSGTVYYDLLISKVERNQNRVLVQDISPFMLGPVVHYKAIKSSIIWAPMSFGNPSLSKHIREGVTLIESDSLSTITIGYATDLSGDFEDIKFQLDGDGGWGDSIFSNVAWGGQGISVPIRTLIPRQKQRCRYIKARAVHGNAFYKFSIMGIAYTYEPMSERAWR